MMKMNNLENHPIMKLIEIDKKHIENFVLETEEGTKRMKEKFHLKAIDNRNEYCNREINRFTDYKSKVENEIEERMNQLLPTNQSSKFEKNNKNADILLNLVVMNTNCSSSFKLKLDYIISGITEETSLEEVNTIIKEFIQNFYQLGINLTIQDFKYSMFTEQYMEMFFKNPTLEEMKRVFGKIYFRCPDIILHLKMNLFHILENYKTLLDKYVFSLTEKELIEYEANEDTIIEKYVKTRTTIDQEIATDPYNNTMLFLEGGKKISDYLEDSPARSKTYDMFVHNNTYDNLSDEGKENYNSAIRELYLTLKELKEYYHYEFILKDLLTRYKNKASFKGQYASKKKEIAKQEKKRMAIYKEYLKANGIGLFAKKDDEKIKNAMLKMNEQILSLNTLYEAYHDLEITNNLSQLTSSASIYDLLTCALSSFSFLENIFKKQEDFQDSTLEENIKEYLTFVYNPNNTILRKINAFLDYDIAAVIAEKYKLLNIELTSSMINSDNIQSTLESIQYIYFIQNIEKSSISLQDIDCLCKMKSILENRQE